MTKLRVGRSIRHGGAEGHRARAGGAGNIQRDQTGEWTRHGPPAVLAPARLRHRHNGTSTRSGPPTAHRPVSDLLNPFVAPHQVLHARSVRCGHCTTLPSFLAVVATRSRTLWCRKVHSPGVVELDPAGGVTSADESMH